jgi:UDP-N-acetylmuramoyl-tripeptide--D-alanyl-D-alanine ligase
VLELGSNHFGEISQLAKICRPNTCVITNIGSSHLKFFKDLNGVFREKTSLLENLISPKIAFLNGDCSFLRNLLSGCFKSAPFFTFGTGKDNDFRAHRVKMERNKLMFYSPLNKSTFCLNTFGSHNVYNAMAAIAVCRIFGIGYDEIRKGLSSFEFPRGRLKFVDLGKDINIVDDTYNSNPSSLQAALTALEAYRNKGRKIFVMGDMLELGESEKFFHTQAANAAARFCDTLITVGNLSSSAARKIAATSGEIKIFTCLSSAEASDVLFDKVSPGKDDIVLVKGSRAMKMDQIFNGIKV